MLVQLVLMGLLGRMILVMLGIILLWPSYSCSNADGNYAGSTDYAGDDYETGAADRHAGAGHPYAPGDNDDGNFYDNAGDTGYAGNYTRNLAAYARNYAPETGYAGHSLYICNYAEV